MRRAFLFAVPFALCAAGADVAQRIMSLSANPEVILASWCGRRVDKDKIRTREGWDAVDVSLPRIATSEGAVKEEIVI